MKIIAGPCQHESYEHSHMIADHCKSICDTFGIEYVFKASYDKANRTSLNSKRGVGFDQTMMDFLKLKENIPRLKILTDFHSVQDINKLHNHSIRWNMNEPAVDIIQIPAFLCRQTDLILAAVEKVKAGIVKSINIKKGQFLAPWDVEGILSKINLPNNQVYITERGTSFGYNTLVVDFTGICYLLDTYNVGIVFDATHSVQRPGGNGTTSGGNRQYVHRLAKAARAVGVNNFFFEIHNDPDNAPSDGQNMVHLKDFERIVDSLL